MDYMITITGISYFIDSTDLEAHQKIILKKEPSNKYDKEAIGVYLNDTMQIGYVANSIRTVAKGTYSAGGYMTKLVIMHWPKYWLLSTILQLHIYQ